MGPYRIVLADDHAMLRQGLKRILAEGVDLEIAGEAGDGIELLGLLKKVVPHLVILDISMPNLGGIEAVYEIKRINPNIKILMLTMHKDEEYLHPAISAGADGYLLKEDAVQDLFSAIEKIRCGSMYISPSLSERITTDWVKLHRGDRKPFIESQPLTTRKREIIKLIAEGKSSREIADMLCISIRTVDHHRAGIMRRLRLRKTADLVRYAIQKGYAD